MTISNVMKCAAATLSMLGLGAAALACGDSLDPSIRRPSEPQEVTLFDLFAGPIDRASALDVIAGAGRVGVPSPVRVDQSEQWDVAFAVLNGEPVWLPRGFFAAFEPSSGIVALEAGFDDVDRVPEDRDLYEMEDPVPIVDGTTYALRSRSDPTLSLPCRIYAKLVVDELQLAPARVRVRVLWNPNCDQRVVTPEPS